MCIFHKWTKWKQYEVNGFQILGRIAPKSVQGKKIPYTELRQKRTCLKCNKVEDRLIKEY